MTAMAAIIMLKNWIFILLISITIILTRLFFQMQGNSFGVNSLILLLVPYLSSERERQFHISLVHVLIKMWNQAFSCHSRAVTAKNLQKACCVCRVVILSIQPIAFLKFSLLSPSCHLKLTMLPTSHKPSQW